MRKTIRLGIIICLMALCQLTPLHAANRQNILWNFDWKFQLGEAANAEKPQFDDSKWQTLNLPYDYQLNQPWDKNAKPSRAFKKRASGWFRKSFTPDDTWKGKQVLIDFEGLMYYGDVYLNGKKIGGTEYGYCGFECDLTKDLKYGQKNVIAVYTNTGVDDGSRWYTGGGINRDVHLIVKGKASLARNGIYVRTTKLNDNTWSVKVQGEYPGEILKTGKVELQARILDANDNEVAKSNMTTAPASSRLNLVEVQVDSFTMANPKIWSIEKPNIYTCELNTYVDGKQTDSERTHFGFRTIEFGKDFGFKLNGKKVFLQGIANHVDFGGVGVASFKTAIERQLKMLKSFGYNAVRCSHNPYPPVFYALCDSLGFVVVDEFVDKWSTDGNCWGGRKPFLDCWFPLLQEFVKRDRNHPCVIMWSLGNEMQHRENASGYETGDWGQTMFRILDVVVKRYDKTRPTTAAMFPARANGLRRNDKGYRDKANILPPEVSTISQVASYNYEYSDYRQYKKVDPNLIIFQSEASVNDLITPWLRMDRPTTVGLCYWGAIEYWGESDGWPKKGWNYSFFDHTLKPYPRAWLVKSVFEQDKPMLHIGVLESEQKSIIWNDIVSGRAEMSHFYWHKNPGDSITLEVYSNADEVELLQNGKSLGTKKNDFANDKKTNKFLWKDLRWQPGNVVAIARKNGKEVARDELQSPTKAVRLKMTVEDAPFTANGMDLKYIRIQAVDAKGRKVSNYNGKLKVDINGEATLVALDNGDHFTDLRLDQTSTPLFRGGALLIIRSTRKAGKVSVKASVDGIKAAAVNLKTL